jgi:ketosteroid isomerase-like protein
LGERLFASERAIRSGVVSDRFSAWIDAYEKAWRTAGTGALTRVFTEDASYRPGPFELTASGLDAIAEFWEAERDGPDEVFTLGSELVAAQGDIGVARVEVVYAGTRRRTYRNLWVITLAGDGRCRAFEEWPFHPEQALTPSEDTLYDGELVDFKLQDVREALTNELGEYYGGIWLSGRGETRRLNVAVTTRAPARTRADVEAIAATAGLGEQVAFPLVVWSLAELEAGRERFEAVVGGSIPDSLAELRSTSIDESRNVVAVAIAPELSEAGLGVLAQAITAAGVPVQVTIQHSGWVALAG